MITTEQVPDHLEEASYNDVFDLMVTQPAPNDYRSRVHVEASFAGAMAYLLETGIPDVFLFTHKSAIPVADSVRAYFEERGEQIPELGVVNTKEEDPNLAVEWKAYRGLVKTHVVSQQVQDRESKLLRPLVEGKSVAVLDQYIESMTTLLRAETIASQSGAVSVNRPVKANWYHDARLADIDVDGISSIHAPQMRNIGHAAARFELPGNWREAYSWPETSNFNSVESTEYYQQDL